MALLKACASLHSTITPPLLRFASEGYGRGMRLSLAIHAPRAQLPTARPHEPVFSLTRTLQFCLIGHIGAHVGYSVPGSSV